MNTFGTRFRVSLFGESHGKGVGVLLDGVPPGLTWSEAELDAAMAKRRPGQSLTSPRSEPDRVEVLSGMHAGHTTGAPLCLWIANQDARSSKEDRHEVPRPGHADYPLHERTHGFADLRGGGHASGRLTAGLVAAGFVASRYLKNHGIKVAAHVTGVGELVDNATYDVRAIQAAEPSWTASPQRGAFEARIESARKAGDSVGGLVSFVVEGLPVGLGEPFFDGLDASFGHLLFSIPAVKGVEFGHGFASARMTGSTHNDPYVAPLHPATNHAGGLLGGLTTGEPLVGRVAFKPTSSIRMTQQTASRSGKDVELSIDGRNDPCIALRGASVVAACVEIAIMDALRCLA